MSLPIVPADTDQHTQPVHNSPPTPSKVTAGLAVLACTACCALPVLLATGILTSAGAAALEQTMLTAAAALVVTAFAMWWLHRRRQTRRATVEEGTCGCRECS